MNEIRQYEMTFIVQGHMNEIGAKSDDLHCQGHNMRWLFYSVSQRLFRTMKTIRVIFQGKSRTSYKTPDK
jgi:hypothetical protein